MYGFHPRRGVCSCHMMTETLSNKLDQAIWLLVVCGRRTFRIYTLVPSIMTENFRSFFFIPLGYCQENVLKDVTFFEILSFGNI
jgi:hypothetical protein